MFAAILAGYVWTLAPTVTFWDAGEFIASARILGIPHPPGTPLFVLLGNVWGRFIPLGEFAYRTNLLAAVCSAGGAGWFFLVVARVLRDEDPFFQYGGAAAAAVLSAFAFTVWQNSNETEVYMVATFSIAATCWLAARWREARGTPRASHLLLLCIYLLAVSLGNHLLALLAGPALIAFIGQVIRSRPLKSPGAARAEWAELAVLAGIWALLLGTGLASFPLLVLGGVLFAGAAVYAIFAGSAGFAVAALLVASVGVSTYLFLFVRAGQHPFINEADPSTLTALLEVIRREQYPVRSPFDNPMQFHGPENTGRTLHMLWWQVVNYLQYFDWQWANGLFPGRPVFAPARFPFTVLFSTLGIFGTRILYRRDRSLFWLLFVLFLTTGPALVGYMNFKPGASLLWNVYRDPNMHEVRERDYFFTVSYQVWGLFAGIGLAGVYRLLRAGRKAGERPVSAVFLIAALPFALNFRAASRAHGPDATLARDFAYDLLQSSAPYGILFTNGDNDTFPLWYLQEVEGVRQDVAVVNLSLANTKWFVRQMREAPVRPFRGAPGVAGGVVAPPNRLLSLTDEQIAGLDAQLLGQDYLFRLGQIEHRFARGTPFFPKDVVLLRLIQENFRRRPVYYSTTVGGENWLGLDRFLTQEALVLRLNVDPPDSSRLVSGVLDMPVDLPRTDSLAWSVYRYAGLFAADSLQLEPSTASIAANLSLPFIALGQAYSLAGDNRRSLENLRRAYHLTPSPELRRVVDSVQVAAEGKK